MKRVTDRKKMERTETHTSAKRRGKTEYDTHNQMKINKFFNQQPTTSESSTPSDKHQISRGNLQPQLKQLADYSGSTRRPAKLFNIRFKAKKCQGKAISNVKCKCIYDYFKTESPASQDLLGQFEPTDRM